MPNPTADSKTDPIDPQRDLSVARADSLGARRGLRERKRDPARTERELVCKHRQFIKPQADVTRTRVDLMDPQADLVVPEAGPRGNAA